MSDDKNICGGITDQGEICTLPAGWGRSDSGGPCRHHSDQRPPPNKLTEQLIVGIESDLKNGLTPATAAPANGISEFTYYHWLRLADDLEDDDTTERAEMLSQFSQRVTHANGSGRRRIDNRIVELAMGDAELPPDVDALIRYRLEIMGGEESQRAQDGEGDDVATVPSDEQLDALLADR